MTLRYEEMSFLAKHYSPSRNISIAAVDEAIKTIDDNYYLAVAKDTVRKLSEMSDEMFESLAVEEWAEKNGVDIVWGYHEPVEGCL
jgi:hypothetical protein